MTPHTLAALIAARAAARPITLATRLSDGTQYLLPDQSAPAALTEAAACVTADEPHTVHLAHDTWFLQLEAPPARLLIIGAVHIAQALASLATITGYGVTIIDPRRGFATQERFPHTTINHAWPDEALDALAPDSRTAIVTLTHDAKLDDPGLDRALRSDSFFIGALGSRKTHAARLERLAALGHAPEALVRIRGPVGLHIGARTAPEIALSVLAELVATRHGVPLGFRHT